MQVAPEAAGLSILEVSAIFLTITALLAYINKRFVGLPTTIGVMAISLLLSIAAIFLGFLALTSSLIMKSACSVS